MIITTISRNQVFYSVVLQLLSHVWLHEPVDCSMPDFTVLHYLMESAQTYVHWDNDAIQPPHPLSFPSPLALSLSPGSGFFPKSWLFASGAHSIGASASASFLPMNIQDWFPLGLTSLISLQSKGFSRVFSKTTVWKHQFFGTQPSLWSNSHIHTWYGQRILGKKSRLLSQLYF